MTAWHLADNQADPYVGDQIRNNQSGARRRITHVADDTLHGTVVLCTNGNWYRHTNDGWRRGLINNAMTSSLWTSNPDR